MTRMGPLAGPEPRGGGENVAEQKARLGPRPRGRTDLIDAIDGSRLLGRGGGSFPAAAKWRAVAGRSKGDATVLVNGAEGEPLSWKDQTLMAARPHLVLDGAFLAAETVGAEQVVLYVGERHAVARAAVERALAERSSAERRAARVVSAPDRYVAGEESAAVHVVNDGVALPTTVPPRPYEHGVAGRTTLVQNVETLAQVALIARFGPAATTSLVTVSGAVRAAGVLEVEPATTVGDVIKAGGGTLGELRAVLLGGYFGSWLDADAAWNLPVDAEALRARGLALGCGVIATLSTDACGACEAARIMRYLAGESASQCGPCFFGLRSLADACDRIVQGRGSPDDLERLHRWSADVPGRGACRHPDGAVQMLRSALRVFYEEFEGHLARRRREAAGGCRRPGPPGPPALRGEAPLK